MVPIKPGLTLLVTTGHPWAMEGPVTRIFCLLALLCLVASKGAGREGEMENERQVLEAKTFGGGRLTGRVPYWAGMAKREKDENDERKKELPKNRSSSRKREAPKKKKKNRLKKEKLRGGVNKRKGKIWSIAIPGGAGVLKKTILLFLVVKKGKNGLKWLQKGKKLVVFGRKKG